MKDFCMQFLSKLKFDIWGAFPTCRRANPTLCVGKSMVPTNKPFGNFWSIKSTCSITMCHVTLFVNKARKFVQACACEL